MLHALYVRDRSANITFRRTIPRGEVNLPHDICSSIDHICQVVTDMN